MTFLANPAHLPENLHVEDDRGKKVGEKVGENLTKNQRAILSQMREQPRISARDLATHVGISSRKVEENIAKLKQLGWIQRVGPAKGGYWEILK